MAVESDLVGKTLLDRYFLREKVGSGGMADVYIAWDKPRSVKMAIKVLRRDLAESPRFLALFAKEAALLRTLEHPNVVRLYEFDKQDDIAFIVMDWVDGGNLRQVVMERRRAFTLEDVSYIIQPVCAALNYAHQQDIYHCDVKPANILLHVDGRVFLSDFGVARLATEQVGGGTPPYMSPEQFSGGEITAQSDVYSLGITIYEMLSGGQVPFRGDSVASQGSTTRDRIAWEHTHLPLPPIRQYNSELPEAIEAFLLTALSKEPELRYAGTLKMQQAFEAARAAGGRPVNIGQTVFTLLPSQTPGRPSRQGEPAKPRQPEPPPGRQQKAQPPAGPRSRAQSAKAKAQVPITRKQPRNLIKGVRLPATPSMKPEKRNRIGPLRAIPSGFLVGRQGDWAQRTIPIPPQGLTLGRGSQNQVRLNEGSVSRLHASLLVTRQGIYIRDENSSLGTYVNNQRISGPTLLRQGDVIRIGYYQVFEFRLR